MVLEAMKMKNELRAPRDGRVAGLRAARPDGEVREFLLRFRRLTMSPETLQHLLQGPGNVTWQSALVIVIRLGLVWLAVAKEYEPLLLLRSGRARSLRTCRFRRWSARVGCCRCSTTWASRTNSSHC